MQEVRSRCEKATGNKCEKATGSETTHLENIECVWCTDEKSPDECDPDDLARWRKDDHITHHAICHACKADRRKIQCVVCGKKKAETGSMQKIL